MVPAGKRQPPRKVRQRSAFLGEPDLMDMPYWTRGDESDEEIEEDAESRRLLSRRRRQEGDASSVRRRTVDGKAAADSQSSCLGRRSSGSEDSEASGRTRHSTRVPTRTRALPTVPPPAPTSVELPPPPPPESSSSVEPPPEPPAGTTVDGLLPTTVFQPVPEPTVGSSSEMPAETSLPTSSDLSGPRTTVTVGDPDSTEVSSSATSTHLSITTPVVALPVLPSESRNGVDGDKTSTDSKDEATSTTRQPKESIPAERAQADRDGNFRGVEQTAPTHVVMHTLGSIGGVLVIAAILGFIWWYFKKYRPKKRLERGDPPSPSAKPSRFRNLFSSFKSSRKATRDREWTVESAYTTTTTFNEKEMQLDTTYEDVYQRRPESVGEQYFAPAQLAVAIPPAHIDPNGNEFWTTWTEKDGRPRDVPNQQSISSTAGRFNNTLRTTPPYYKRTSEVSSLSSGFGDGDITMPPSTANNTLDMTPLTQLAPPPPTSNPRRFSNRTESTSRDTWYTATSEDQPARFRTINSWVRQQTGRIKREKQRNDESDVPPVPALPAEEEYRMMMPDGEEPRRVDMNMDGRVAYGGTR